MRLAVAEGSTGGWGVWRMRSGGVSSSQRRKRGFVGFRPCEEQKTKLADLLHEFGADTKTSLSRWLISRCNLDHQTPG